MRTAYGEKQRIGKKLQMAILRQDQRHTARLAAPHFKAGDFKRYRKRRNG